MKGWQLIIVDDEDDQEVNLESWPMEPAVHLVQLPLSLIWERGEGGEGSEVGWGGEEVADNITYLRSAAPHRE